MQTVVDNPRVIASARQAGRVHTELRISATWLMVVIGMRCEDELEKSRQETAARSWRLLPALRSCSPRRGSSGTP